MQGRPEFGESATIYLTTISSTCHAWRDLVIGYPILWTDISLRLGSRNAPPCQDLIEAYIDRSNNAPFSVYIVHHEVNGTVQSRISWLSPLLHRHIHRCRRLEAYFECYEDARTLFPLPGTLPAMERLEVTLEMPLDDTNIQVVPLVTTAADAPIRILKVESDEIPFDFEHLPANHLTSLQIAAPAHDTTSSLLARQTSLRFLSLTGDHQWISESIRQTYPDLVHLEVKTHANMFPPIRTPNIHHLTWEAPLTGIAISTLSQMGPFTNLLSFAHDYWNDEPSELLMKALGHNLLALQTDYLSLTKDSVVDYFDQSKFPQLRVMRLHMLFSDMAEEDLGTISVAVDRLLTRFPRLVIEFDEINTKIIRVSAHLSLYIQRAPV